MASLSKRRIEHPLVTELFNTLVLRGDFEQALGVVGCLRREGLFESECARVGVEWEDLTSTLSSGPGERFGSAMCIDVANQVIYIMGGCETTRRGSSSSGSAFLCDLWRYSIPDNSWTLVESEFGDDSLGWTAHQMVFDPTTQALLIFGRLAFESEQILERFEYGTTVIHPCVMPVF